MVKATVRKPPSRVRYENNHPTVSCRLSREFYDSLVKARTQEQKSFADILKLGLGKIESTNKKLNEASKKSFERGYEKGHSDAENVYKVTYHCSRCGQPMVVDHQEEKKAIDEYMSSKWHHQECPRPKITHIL